MVIYDTEFGAGAPTYIFVLGCKIQVHIRCVSAASEIFSRNIMHERIKLVFSKNDKHFAGYYAPKSVLLGFGCVIMTRGRNARAQIYP